MKECNVALYASETPEILVLEITAITIFVNLYGYLILSLTQVSCDIKFARFKRALTIPYPLTVHPNIKSRLHAIKTQEYLSRLPRQRQLKGTTILSRRITFIKSRPTLLRFRHDVWRIYLERISGRNVDRSSIAVNLPIGRN